MGGVDYKEAYLVARTLLHGSWCSTLIALEQIADPEGYDKVIDHQEISDEAWKIVKDLLNKYEDKNGD